MTKIYREFFDRGTLRKEIYYDSETSLISELKQYNVDGSLMLHVNPSVPTTLEQAKTSFSFKIAGYNATYVDEDALRAEESLQAVERAREQRIEAERRIEQRRREAAAHEARMKAAERYIGRTLGSDELC